MESATHRRGARPERAIGTDQTKKFVYVVEADGKPQFREVHLGALYDGMRVVQGDVKRGEHVVVDGLQRIQPGMTVAPAVLQVDAKGMPIFPPQGAAAHGATREAGREELTKRRMDISRFFIDRPRFAAVLSISIFLLGLLSIFRLPSPSIPRSRRRRSSCAPSFPAPTRASSPRPSRRRSRSRSTASRTCCTSSRRARRRQHDADGDLQDRHRSGGRGDGGAEPDQPRPAAPARIVRQIGVTTEKSSPNLTMVVHLVSPDNSRDALYLRNYGQLNVRDELLRIPGMGSVILFGAGDYAMRIWLDPAKLAARSITTGEVVAAIREQNAQVAAGTVGAPPRPRAPSSSSPSTRRVGSRAKSSSPTSSCAPSRRRAADPHPRPRPGRALGRLVLAAQPAQQQGSGGDRRLPGAGIERARRSRTTCARRWSG
jgi:hypothetical protein